jgi:3-methyladenine DNA glycosylase Tag
LLIELGKCFLAVQKEFGSFDRYIWGFVNNRPVNNRLKEISEMPARTPLSDQVSKDLMSLFGIRKIPRL